MTHTFTPIDTSGTFPPDFLRRLYVSVGVHVLLLAGIPLAIHFLYKPRKFTRPQTFQLVRLAPPRAQAPSARPVEKPPTTKPVEPTPKNKPEPRPAQAKPEPKPQAAQQTDTEDDLSELNDLLGTVAAPAVDVSGAPSDFKYPWYLNAVIAEVERNWRPSVNDPKLSVELVFTIFRTGTIGDVTLRRSSGNSSLDNLAVRAVKLAAPFGSLPAGYTEPSLEIGLKLVATVR